MSSAPRTAKPLWRRDEDSRPGGVRDPLDRGLSGRRAPQQTTGVHHIALVCRDMKQTIAFYEAVFGMRCRAVYPMHNIPGAKHCFLDAGNGTEISFVEFNDARPGVPGVSFPASNTTDSPTTTLHHLALKVDTLDQLYRVREQAKKFGVKVSRPIDHHFIHSIYLQDPSGFQLEVTCTTAPYSAEEYQPEILDRKLRPEENAWDEPAAMARAAKIWEDVQAGRMLGKL